MKKVSVKTLDGNRNEFEVPDGWDVNSLISTYYSRFLEFYIDNGTKYFNIDNIVSITEREDTK